MSRQHMHICFTSIKTEKLSDNRQDQELIALWLSVWTQANTEDDK